MYIRVPEYLTESLRRFEELKCQNPRLLSAEELQELDDIVCDVIHCVGEALKEDLAAASH